MLFCLTCSTLLKVSVKYCSGVSTSTDDQQHTSAALLGEVNYFFLPNWKLEVKYYSKEPKIVTTFKPQYPHANSPNWSLYISFKNKLREFDKRSRHFPLGDHFINSHNLISWHCMDIVRRKLRLVTIGT